MERVRERYVDGVHARVLQHLLVGPERALDAELARLLLGTPAVARPDRDEVDLVDEPRASDELAVDTRR
jgi:hypothetical protein